MLHVQEYIGDYDDGEPIFSDICCHEEAVPVAIELSACEQYLYLLWRRGIRGSAVKRTYNQWENQVEGFLYWLEQRLGGYGEP